MGRFAIGAKGTVHFIQHSFIFQLACGESEMDGRVPGANACFAKVISYSCG